MNLKNTNKPQSGPDWNQFMPGIAIDCVIFGYHDKELKILILEYKKTGLFALPGGFIKRDEALDDAAKRVLNERTGLTDIYLNQFHTFGNLNRSDPTPMKTVLENNGVSFNKNHFLLQRFISVSYYALVDFKKAEPVADPLSDSCKWIDINELPPLILDHEDIYQKAHEHLKKNINREAVGLNLLSDTFTMAELQGLHESILDRELNRTSFHRKMMLSGHLKRIGKKKTGKAHRSPYLYKFIE
tara:strand:+ start:4100 stop:4828 length:729 start_codon:yes stop_codon:yes gene_type:complete